ncbi:hypothetical protein BDR04DRAFT_1213782, partial [Suillus decipiens]
IPRKVRLRAKLKNSEEILDDLVLVTEVKPFKDEWSSIPLLHTLAAWQLVKDLSEGRAPLPKPISPASDEDIRKAGIVRLGLDYQLVSEHTSFFAEESGHETARRLRRSTSWQRSRRQRCHTSIADNPFDEGASGTNVSTVQTVLDSLSQAVSAVFNFFPDPLPTTRRCQAPLPSTYYSAAQSRSAHWNALTRVLDGLTRPPSPIPPPEDPIQRAPSPVFDAAPPGAKPAAPPRIAPPIPKEAYTVISLQKFDGSFMPSPQLGAIVGIDTLAKAVELQVDGNIWATATVVAYLRHQLGAQPHLLDALINKALEHIDRRDASLLVGRDFWDLVNIAGQSVGPDLNITACLLISEVVRSNLASASQCLVLGPSWLDPGLHDNFTGIARARATPRVWGSRVWRVRVRCRDVQPVVTPYPSARYTGMFTGSCAISGSSPRCYMLVKTGFTTHYNSYFSELVDCNSDPLLLSYFSLFQDSYQLMFFRLGDSSPLLITTQ